MSVSLVRTVDLKAAAAHVIELQNLEDARQQVKDLVVQGHFKHRTFSVPPRCSQKWFDVHPLWENPFRSSEVLQAIVSSLPSDIRDRVEVFAGPPTGGYAMARDMARYESSSRRMGKSNVSCVPIDKVGDSYQLRDYFKKRIRYKEVILTEDVRWEGYSYNACASEIIAAGAHLLAVVFIIDCCFDGASSKLPIFALKREERGPVWDQPACPMCKAGTPFTALPLCATCSGTEKVLCLSCGGTGGPKCINCGGSGDAPLAPGTCSVCDGSGGPRCSGCGGSGRIKCTDCKAT